MAAIPPPSASPSSTPPNTAEQPISITFTHHGTPHTYTFPPTSTLTDLSTRIHANLSIPPTNQKFVITPKLGVLKPPFPTPSPPLTTLLSKKILLLAPTAAEIATLTPPSYPSNPHLKPSTPTRHRDWRKTQEEATYTFHTLLPLPHLPHPSRSLALLSRLRSDPGIITTMRLHKFSVGLLTEMNPADHTTHSGKTLGLNRNRGEVIELRLRTDAYDGYRDYKTIRDTLCHELAHCVWGEHDGRFWQLTREIEREVREGDWRSGGRAVSDEVFYDPQDREGSGGEVDGGGWSGGEYVLGGGGEGGAGAGAPAQTLSRREIMAKAAEERMKRQREAGEGGSGESA